MVERLTTLDASFLYLEEPRTPMHVGGVVLLDSPPGGVEAIAGLVEARLPLIPRYRQRVMEVPGHLANPVWVDDPDFDLAYHVRRSALPRPGTETQLLELVSRLASRALNRGRPLWELYLVEGVSGDRIAVISKTHPALVDGLSAVDIGQVLLDPDPRATDAEREEWRPRRPPGRVELVRGALGEYVRRPSALVDAARGAVTDVRSTSRRLAGVASGTLRATRSALFPAPPTPLNATVGRQRRVAVARIALDDVRRIAKTHGGTVDDVLLTVVSGALREWLLSRGQPVVGATTVRALVPVGRQGEGGDHLSPLLVDLPVGEPNPRVRLTRLSYAMQGVTPQSQFAGTESLMAVTGFAPPTLHALGARAARGLPRRLFNVVVTTVPGPEIPLYVAGGRVLEVFPVIPLARGQGLSIGMTSYGGRVVFGLNADRDSMGDVDVLADLLEQEAGELADSAD